MTYDTVPASSGWERERMLEALEAYRRGLCEPPLIRKWSPAPGTGGPPGDSGAPAGSQGGKQEGGRGNAGGVKDSGGYLEAPSMTFVVSTDEVDRHGDVIATHGWQLDSYRKNPVFLWAHDYARPVIGKAAEVWTEPHSLVARMEFAPTNFAREVAALYQAGYQRGVSVGFKPLRFEERRHQKTGALLGLTFLEQELLETSAVPVPANRSALRRALEQAPISREYLQRIYAGAEDAMPLQAQQDAEVQLSSLQLVWPELLARLDDLEELAGELAEMSRRAYPESSGKGAHTAEQGAAPDGRPATLTQLLAALRGEAGA